jgi:hypothetical protein
VWHWDSGWQGSSLRCLIQLEVVLLMIGTVAVVVDSDIRVRHVTLATVTLAFSLRLSLRLSDGHSVSHLESYPPGINMYVHFYTMYVRALDHAIVRTMLKHVCTYHGMYIHVCTWYVQE